MVILHYKNHETIIDKIAPAFWVTWTEALQISQRHSHKVTYPNFGNDTTLATSQHRQHHNVANVSTSATTQRRLRFDFGNVSTSATPQSRQLHIIGNVSISETSQPRQRLKVGNYTSSAMSHFPKRLNLGNDTTSAVQEYLINRACSLRNLGRVLAQLTQPQAGFIALWFHQRVHLYQEKSSQNTSDYISYSIEMSTCIRESKEWLQLATLSSSEKVEADCGCRQAA